jgi:hypothetical protein
VSISWQRLEKDLEEYEGGVLEMEPRVGGGGGGSVDYETGGSLVIWDIGFIKKS